MKNIKAIRNWLLGAAMASALVLVAPNKADAQVSFGVRVGAPVVAVGYYGPYHYDGWHRRVYYGPGYWQPAIVPYHYDRWHRDHFYGRYGWRR